MMMLDIPLVAPGTAEGYYIKESESESYCHEIVGYRYSSSKNLDSTFFPDRRADVFYKNCIVGTFGIVHPEVLGNFEIGYPCSALELDLEPFV